MLGTFLIVFIGFISAYGAYTQWGTGWGLATGIVFMLVGWVILGLLLRRVSMAKQLKIQQIMEDGQNKVNRQVEMFSRRPQSSMNGIRPIIEKIQRDATLRALEATDDFKSLYKWSPMLKKQIASMKVQLYFQLKDNKMVDELLPQAMMLDPQTVAVKMVRMYRTGDAGLDKFYKRVIRRFRGDTRAFIACVYAWMKLKKDDTKSALDALLNAKKLSDHQVLLDNIEHLVNGKVKHFSNAGFNEMWYALMLEEPKMKPQRRGGRMF